MSVAFQNAPVAAATYWFIFRVVGSLRLLSAAAVTHASPPLRALQDPRTQSSCNVRALVPLRIIFGCFSLYTIVCCRSRCRMTSLCISASDVKKHISHFSFPLGLSLLCFALQSLKYSLSPIKLHPWPLQTHGFAPVFFFVRKHLLHHSYPLFLPSFCVFVHSRNISLSPLKVHPGALHVH